MSVRLYEQRARGATKYARPTNSTQGARPGYKEYVRYIVMLYWQAGRAPRCCRARQQQVSEGEGAVTVWLLGVSFAARIPRLKGSLCWEKRSIVEASKVASRGGTTA